MSIRFVALDLGGVLVDVDLQHIRATYNHAALFAKHDALSEGALAEADFISDAASRMNVDAATLRDDWCRVVKPSRGSQALLNQLRVPSTAWSNTDPMHAAALASLSCLNDRAALSFAVGAQKPQRAFYQAARSKLPFAPSEILFVDDREENVGAARSMGVCADVVRGIDETRALLLSYGLLHEES